ncbi:hypothetical protein DFH29DRAFT_966546 [Suillus ampliporus]|nr:hypothetical protein DFH29DRAFT_966546 [Suillus ampliporus]
MVDCRMLCDCRRKQHPYVHFEAPGCPGWMANEPLQNDMHPEFRNLHDFDTAFHVSQCHAQSKTSCWPSSPGSDLRSDDSLSRIVLSPSSFLSTAVAQHDVRSAVRQTSCNGFGDSPETGQSPTTLLHSHWVSQPDTLHHQLQEGTICEQDLSFNIDVSQLRRECLWTDGQGRCGFMADTVKSMLKHVSSYHLHQPPAHQVQCLFGGCSRTMRRDTILRHIREIHYGDKSRCKRPS